MSLTGESNAPASSGKTETIAAAFGAVNRGRLIDAYFAQLPSGRIKPQSAWMHVYQLLLWVDQTNGLAHCYESDKSQPGKGWYARSLAFHDWVSSALGTTPAELAIKIDWLFLRASEDLAAHVLHRAADIAAKAAEQRKAYEGRGFPRPGEDSELIAIVRRTLGTHLAGEPPPEVWNRLVERIRQYLALDNKRKNLVGEGFEDVLAQVIRRTSHNKGFDVSARRLLHDLPGFNRVRAGDKPNKVDVAVIRPTMRTLITAKWSVRADREKQFLADFADYLMAEADRKPFQYVLVTNEFDPARLMRACEQLSGNNFMFTRVVHINTDALRATYSPNISGNQESTSMKRVLSHIDSGRLVSLGQWLVDLGAE